VAVVEDKVKVEEIKNNVLAVEAYQWQQSMDDLCMILNLRIL
jgi:hypothetical protein